MITNAYTKWLSTAVLGTALCFAPSVMAQSVVFPQAKQAGTAVLAKTADTYTLQNELLKATFKKQGETLVFGGCPELNLEEGTDLFEVKLGTGTEIAKSSQMTLLNVQEINYEADATAVKGAKKLAGKAIEATFQYKNLTIKWRAVLRDGSHYLRTELELAAGATTKMFSITPMIYNVNVVDAGSAPKVVGNTRGAVLLSDKIFAGLETPMGINQVQGADQTSFTFASWTPESFSWVPESVAAEIINLGFTKEQIVATKGYLSFKNAGQQTITFTYTKGTHKLNIAGVEVVDVKTGAIVSSDYHYGRTGGTHANNTYNVNIPQKGTYEVRYYVATYALQENISETITSEGRITYSGNVIEPILVYDLQPGSQPSFETQGLSTTNFATRALSANTIADGGTLSDNWTPATWTTMPAAAVPLRIGELGFNAPNVQVIEQELTFSNKGEFKAEFLYASGNQRLNLVGMDIVNAEGQVVTYDYHIGYTGRQKDKNIYTLAIPVAGTYKLRYFAENKSETNGSTGNINLSLIEKDILHLAVSPIVKMTGVWSRNTNLLKDETWKVSSVVGIVAPNQARRSFLAYSERERAVPWRAMPAYISWYELNINRNNDRNYTNNMNVEQCADVVGQWKKNLYDKYGESINSFVWDDGWDFYGPWTFNKNFPNGFKEPDELAKQMGSGIGAWLGPVGGYGESGNYRRAYWNGGAGGTGGMQLSNPAYYKAFTDAITDLCNGRGYDFRFFKFDGISAQFSSVGPDAGTTGEENAEGIIRAERMVRETIKEDIFFNTTVGTWASPFWFQYTDAIWRQENDYGEIGNQGSDREKWITYRDRLVYQNFVKNSPICPINTLMTHGFILSKWGSVSKDMSYEGIVREMRCAFACGSGMVELYNDYLLMNNLYGGRLWGDLAECLRWQKANADVLPDAHWVGGNPWTGSKAEVYGWASWNGPKSTLALRNPAASTATYRTTLRQALEIPAHVTGAIILTKAFGNQAELSGLTEGEAIDIDTQLNLTLPASSVFVFNGRESHIPAIDATGVKFNVESIEVAPGKQQALIWNVLPLDVTVNTVTWSSSDNAVATVNNGIVTGVKEGMATITVTTSNGFTATITVNVATPPQEPYHVNFDKDVLPSGSDRYLRNVSVTTEEGETQTFPLNTNRKPYQDLTANEFVVPMGSTITPVFDWQGTWMHGYVYVDLDNNQRFDVADANSPELVSFTYYQGKDKTGAARANSSGVGNLPAFFVPATPGTYRMRFKIDWDNIDPAGQVDPTNDIVANRGSITDITLKVVDPNGIHTASTTQSMDVAYDLFGRRVAETASGVYIVNGKKVVY